MLANDYDIDDDSLTMASLVTGPTDGSLTFHADGTFEYTPNIGFVGTDTFTYRANDGALNSNVATVSIQVLDVNVVPVAGDDAYAGVASVDVRLRIMSPPAWGWILTRNSPIAHYPFNFEYIIALVAQDAGPIWTWYRDTPVPPGASLRIGGTGRALRYLSSAQAILQPVAGSCKALAATPSTSFTLALTCLR